MLLFSFQFFESTLLNKIISAKAGEVIKNPSKTGKKSIKTTALLKKRVNLAKNLKKI